MNSFDQLTNIIILQRNDHLNDWKLKPSSSDHTCGKMSGVNMLSGAVKPTGVDAMSSHTDRYTEFLRCTATPPFISVSHDALHNT